MNTAAPCALCDPYLGPVLHVSAHWRLVLNRNQDLLGKCFLALRRHEESVADLAGGEWTELHQQLRLATDALRRAFQPDHVNCVFLQNQNRHVHLHIVPRYAGERRLAGISFDDPGYPGHYRVDGPPRLLERAARDELVRRIESAIAARRASGPY
jgi:diadenosine tetraphosphate (Ap4A) HIT family hydrolase